MNERDTLTRLFAARLVSILAQNGHVSRSASTGIKVKELAENACCSFEMARRYASGDALPDAVTIKLIADWLKVDPGWLLYGTYQEQHVAINNLIVLTSDNLKLLFTKIISAYLKIQSLSEKQMEQVNDFFCEVIIDFSKLRAPHEMKLKILNTSIQSILHFFKRSDDEISPTL